MTNVRDHIQINPFAKRRADQSGEDVFGAASGGRHLDSLVRVDQDHILHGIVAILPDTIRVRHDVSWTLVRIPDAHTFQRRGAVEEYKWRAIRLATAGIDFENG